MTSFGVSKKPLAAELFLAGGNDRCAIVASQCC